MSTVTLPSAAGANVEYNNYYESKLNQRFGLTDTNCYPQDLPAASAGFLVLDPAGSAPEHIFYNAKGSNYVSVPSIVAGQGRGVGGTPITDWPAGTTIGLYTIAEYFEGIVTGSLMRDGFLQTRHFSSAVNPNSWIGTGESWNYVGNNGQKEFQYLVAGDKTSKYSKGMKLQMPRVTAVGTRNAHFTAASSQNASKATPSGFGGTTAVTFSTEVYLDSYQSGGWLATRSDQVNGGTNFRIDNGLFGVQWFGASINRLYVLDQLLPLKRWVRITVAVTFATNTVAMWLNDTPAPIRAVSTTGTGYVAGAYTLYLGSGNGAVSFFDGAMAETSFWSAALTDAQVRGLNKQLTGAEANLISYYKLDGNFNDSAANANHLTAGGGAVATNTGNPFNATEYGIITGLDFSAGNTTITLFCGTDCNAPAENLTGIAYSSARAPYGFPADEDRWIVEYINNIQHQGNTTTGAFINVGDWLNIPRGDWKLHSEMYVIVSSPGSTFMSATGSVSPSATGSDTRFTGTTPAINVSLTQMGALLTRESPITNAALAPWYQNVSHNVGGSQVVYVSGGSGTTVLRAYCPYV